jgi:hypothetical protein
VEQSEVAKGNEKRVKLIQKYRTVVEKELDDICGEILELLDKHLIPSASTCEASVFYLKMKADYLRYLSEFKVETDRKDAADKTLMAYNAAQDKALAELPSTNPIRLGLALNFSVFYYEVMNQPEKACNLAKQVRSLGQQHGVAVGGVAVCRPSCALGQHVGAWIRSVLRIRQGASVLWMQALAACAVQDALFWSGGEEARLGRAAVLHLQCCLADLSDSLLWVLFGTRASWAGWHSHVFIHSWHFSYAPLLVWHLWCQIRISQVKRSISLATAPYHSSKFGVVCQA